GQPDIFTMVPVHLLFFVPGPHDGQLRLGDESLLGLEPFANRRVVVLDDLALPLLDARARAVREFGDDPLHPGGEGGIGADGADGTADFRTSCPASTPRPKRSRQRRIWQ